MPTSDSALSDATATSTAGTAGTAGTTARGRYHHGDLRRALVVAATALAREGGPEAVVLREVTRRVGVSANAAYRHFTDRDALLEAVVDRCAEEVTHRLVRGLDGASDGFGRVEAMVRAMFRLAARHPAMLGFLREVARLGPPSSTRLLTRIEPLIARASDFLKVEMDAGRMQRHEPRLLLLAAYSMVTGMATEADVLRAFGEEPTLPSLLRRRDELLSLLRAALEPRARGNQRGGG